MLRRFYDELYGSTPAEFPSDFSLSESVQRLADAVHAPLFVLGGEPRVQGSSSERYVSIHRVVPGVRNSFKPVFTGAFHEQAGRVVLRGAYSLDDGVKFFMSAWLILCLLASVAMTKTVFEQGELNFIPLVPLAMVVFGVLFIAAGRARARRDPERISEVIARALRATPPLTLH